MYAWALLATVAAVAFGAGAFSAELLGAEFTQNWTIGTFLGGFFASALIGLYLFYGFEACGDVAEEVTDPGRTVPRSMRWTVITGAITALILMLALILAIPNMDQAINGKNPNLVDAIFINSFGVTGTKIFFAIALISFLSWVLSLQAAVSRMIYSFGRDRMVFGHKVFGAFNHRLGIPPGAMAAAVGVPAVIVLISKISEDALAKIISFATVGIYIAFQMVVLAALVARIRGWRPAGKWTLGKFGYPVTISALIYGIAGAVNMAWPRTPDSRDASRGRGVAPGGLRSRLNCPEHGP